MDNNNNVNEIHKMETNEEQTLDSNDVEELVLIVLAQCDTNEICIGDQPIRILKPNHGLNMGANGRKIKLTKSVQDKKNAVYNGRGLGQANSSDFKKKKNNSKLSEKILKNNNVDSDNFKIPLEAKHYKKIFQRKTPAQPIQYHSIFDNNLLLKNGNVNGCKCTAKEGVEFTNPFCKDFFKNITYKDKIHKCALVYKNQVNKTHVITFDPIEEFQRILTMTRPTLYVSEYVMGTNDNIIGTKYKLIINLAKGNNSVGDYVVEHIFTKTEPKFLEIHINDYKDFDHIYYTHLITHANPDILIDLNKINSIEIGKSVLKFLSKTIEWTKPGPKVIVEKIEPLPGHLFY